MPNPTYRLLSFQGLVIMANNESLLSHALQKAAQEATSPCLPSSSSLVQMQQDERVHLLRASLKYRGLTTLDHVYWLNTISSTNDAIKQLDAPCALILSNEQTAGRGQAGRQWYSPEGNLYLSLLWTLQHPLSGRLALEAALSLVTMPLFQQHAGLTVKWPNDLYFNQAKWGGILIEPLSDHRVVIGVGLNLTPMPDRVESQAVTDLGTILNEPVDTLELAIQTTFALIHACKTFEQGSFELPVRFASFDALFQQAVVVSNPAQPDIQGTVMGIQPDGALQLDSPEGVKIIYSGQVRPLSEK